MAVLSLVGSILSALLFIYIVLLLARLVLEYIPMFNREWRPRGAVLVIAEIVYTVTDPPIRLIRRFIPPLRIGGIAFDFGFAITMFLCFLLLSVTRSLSAL
ncbi:MULTISPECIES: YggT family protein [Microbacterium]|uniref:Membrane protein n=1 Tax=Microbacterium testaceum TaxID=2033 RepID=A0A147F7Z5_MICTE|nr:MULTISPECIES: YggT family protein [Microbacterium]KTS05443.1 membrane protein [Microbacterium testaceum]KTS12154.1 membrane protein [Microbacterium testaceum]KTS66196.1 membrane protein [Microbacterium testaceum]MDF2044787.1 YggT family protein [Microbacterium sp. Kw_RZR3]MDQ1077240.1 YggT family protein [Microbacterium sp. SORGH_AS_0969]